MVADCVCSVASEELKQEEWGIDVVLTGSQKGIGCPPGLSILTVSPRAMKVKVASLFYKPIYGSLCGDFRGSFNTSSIILRQLEEVNLSFTFKLRSLTIKSFRWLPIMKAYESGSPAYFATPPVNLIYALHTALETITKKAPSLPDRLRRHQQASSRVKEACETLGLKQVSSSRWDAGIPARCRFAGTSREQIGCKWDECYVRTVWCQCSRHHITHECKGGDCRRWSSQRHQTYGFIRFPTVLNSLLSFTSEIFPHRVRHLFFDPAFKTT